MNYDQGGWLLMMLVVVLQCSTYCLVEGSPKVSAMYVFGDSVVDTGNNNFLNSIAKANYYPYGIDSPSRFPTGKFSNGMTVGDYLGRINYKCLYGIYILLRFCIHLFFRV